MKVAICGLWHVHAWGYYERAAKLGEVVGVWEENDERRNEFCEKFGVPVFETLDDLLASDAEGVIVCTSTDTHVDVMVKLADAGKHIFTEKVLALTDEGAAKVEEAVKRNGVQFVISLPWKYSASQIALHDIAVNELGRLNYARFRNCHGGSVDNWLPPHFYDAKECGGGAMIDLGAHGMYLIDWICGQPISAASVFTKACDCAPANVDGVEDNAVTVMRFADGCIAVNETGFVSRGCPAIMEIGGENGYVRDDNNGVVKSTAATGYKPVKVDVGKGLPDPLEQFLTGNILPGCGIQEAKNLTHMMVMAYGNQV